jgi:excisionase family DNA binding protein
MSNSIPLYTILQFVTTFGVSRSAVYREIRDGGLKAVKVGRRTMIRATDADAWLRRLEAFKPKQAA